MEIHTTVVPIRLSPRPTVSGFQAPVERRPRDREQPCQHPFEPSAFLLSLACSAHLFCSGSVSPSFHSFSFCLCRSLQDTGPDGADPHLLQVRVFGPGQWRRLTGGLARKKPAARTSCSFSKPSLGVLCLACVPLASLPRPRLGSITSMHSCR